MGMASQVIGQWDESPVVAIPAALRDVDDCERNLRRDIKSLRADVKLSRRREHLSSSS